MAVPAQETGYIKIPEKKIADCIDALNRAIRAAKGSQRLTRGMPKTNKYPPPLETTTLTDNIQRTHSHRDTITSDSANNKSELPNQSQ